MKRSFYEMLGITRDANHSQIETAYELATAKLNAANLRGVAETVRETRLIRDGYQILSNPEKRTRYDAKLLADETDAKPTYFPADNSARRKPGWEFAVFVGLAVVLGAIVYPHLASKMDEVRIEHVQAVARHKEEQTKVIVIDTMRSQPAVVNVANDLQKR